MIRTKEQKRRGAFAYRGNASVIEASVGPVAWFKSPNRVLEQHRSSNRGRKTGKAAGEAGVVPGNIRNHADKPPGSRSLI